MYVECEEECKVVCIQGSGQTMKTLIKVKSVLFSSSTSARLLR